MPTASFSVRHSNQRISFSRSILPRVNLSCKDVEILVEKTYARWRARSSVTMIEAKCEKWCTPFEGVQRKGEGRGVRFWVQLLWRGKGLACARHAQGGGSPLYK